MGITTTLKNMVPFVVLTFPTDQPEKEGDISQRHYSFSREMTSAVRAHQYGISALVPQSWFRGKIIGGVAK